MVRATVVCPFSFVFPPELIKVSFTRKLKEQDTDEVVNLTEPEKGVMKKKTPKKNEQKAEN